MKSLEKALYEKLKTLAGGKVYPMKAPARSAGPFIIFQRTDSSRVRSINRPSGLAQAYIQVDAYAPTYYAAKELGQQIEAMLDGFRGVVYYDATSIEVAGISMQNDVDIFDQTDEPFLFRSYASYLVTYHQQ